MSFLRRLAFLIALAGTMAGGFFGGYMWGYPLQVAGAGNGEDFVSPQITGEAALAMDAGTGEVLYYKEPFRAMAPASTTKMLTAIVVAENASFNDMVTVGWVPGMEGSKLKARPGEVFCVGELMGALLVASANDAGWILAQHIGGSQEGFARMMNRKAKELGCVNSHFVNPHGLPNNDHLSCAWDIAIIGREMASNPRLARLVARAEYRVEPTNLSPARIYQNTNKFLTSTGTMICGGDEVPISWPLVTGVKTGFTRAAGHCLVSSAVSGGAGIIAVVLKSTAEDIYPDSRLLLEHALARRNRGEQRQEITLYWRGSRVTLEYPAFVGINQVLYISAKDVARLGELESIWVSASKQLRLRGPGVNATFSAGSEYGDFSGAKYDLDAVVRVYRGRVYLPPKAVRAVLQSTLEWDPDSRQVRLLPVAENI
jgi:D-alanyl-D-alanine carboxypeptidase (penicillin-binding protein 5/6)